MHEMSLAGGILQLVEDAARREHFDRVQRLVLECGALAGVELRALRFALDAISPGTVLQGAEILIDEVSGSAWCLRCSEPVPIRSRTDDCPRCGGHQLQPTGGTELRVRELLVPDEPAPAPTEPTQPTT